MTTTTTTSPIRAFIADDVWNGLPEADKVALNEAYVNADLKAFLTYVAGGVLSPDDAFAIAMQAKADRDSRLDAQPGFFYNPGKKSYHPQVHIVGPTPSGFSDVQRRAISAHQIALTVALCKSIGADSVMAMCREALALTATAKASKDTKSTFGKDASAD